MIARIPNAPNQATKLGEVVPSRKIHLTVSTAASTIYISRDRNSLESPPPFAGGVGGLTLADTTGTVELEWTGELWAIGAAANASTPFVEVQL